MGFLDKTGFTYFVNKVIGKTSISGVGDGTLKGAISTLNTGKLSKTGDASNVTTSFSQASSRANIATGEKQSVMMGKIKKWFADMTAAAFAQIITSNTDLMANTVAGYLVDALAVKQQFDVVNSNLNARLTSNGLQALNCTITSGGYCKIGKLVVVNMRISNTSEKINRTINGFPKYSGSNRVSINGYDYADSTFHSASIDTNGQLLVENISTNGSIITGCYICD